MDFELSCLLACLTLAAGCAARPVAPAAVPSISAAAADAAPAAVVPVEAASTKIASAETAPAADTPEASASAPVAPVPAVPAAPLMQADASAAYAAPPSALTHGDYLARPAVRAWIADTAQRFGLEATDIARVLADAQYQPEAVRLIAPPAPATAPVKPRTWAGYRARFVEPVRIAGGLRFWEANAAALDRARERYGVPAEIVVAIAGVETVYGRVQGNFRAVDTLATLGFDWPAELPRDRSAYFREQLAQLFAYAAEHRADPAALKGSYAGAIGIAQFMPGTVRGYAVDFDGDGMIDLHDDPADAIGSIAHYLAEHGWRGGEPVSLAARVGVDDPGPYIAHDLQARHTQAELAQAGVRCAGAPAAAPDQEAPRYGLVDLETPGAPTEYRCAGANFFAITQYNRSFFYAAAVSDLAATLRAARTHAQRPREAAAVEH